MLQRSVITSSSLRILRNLFAEIQGISGVDHFDLLLLREVDIKKIQQIWSKRTATEERFTNSPVDAVTQFLAQEDFKEIVLSFIRKQSQVTPEWRVQYSAFASFAPDITSIYKERRETAIAALVNIVDIALTLQQEEYMKSAIVEVVCGSVLDPCVCESCVKKDGDKHTLMIKRQKKIEILIDSLKEVVGRVLKRTPGASFALALETEPGESYILNGLNAMDTIKEEIQKEPLLAANVGYNVDIAHMRVLGISSEQLRDYLPYIVHAHIADLPYLHTLDQPPGRWTHVYRRDNPFMEYIRLLKEREEQASSLLPFSGAIALELEGCNRLDWIHRGLIGLQRLIDIAYNYPAPPAPERSTSSEPLSSDYLREDPA